MLDDAPEASQERPLSSGNDDPEAQMDESAERTNKMLDGWVDMLKQCHGSAGESIGLPVLPAEPTGDVENQTPAITKALHRFYQNSLTTCDELQRPGDEFVPALLFPFRNHEKIRHDFPLVLFPPSAMENDRLLLPLSELLNLTINEIAPNEDDSRILKDNRSRLELHVNEGLAGTVTPVDAIASLIDASKLVLDELSLNADNARQLKDDLQKIVKAIPQGATLLTLNEDTVVSLYIHAARHRARVHQSQLRDQVTRMRNKLRDLLRTDHGKEDEGRGPESLSKSVGDASSTHIDPEQLSQVIGPSRGAEPMELTRQHRLKDVVAVLERHLSREDEHILTVILADNGRRAANGNDVDWKIEQSDVCKAASKLFDNKGQQYAELFGALRVGRLELTGAYEPQRHDALLESFTWEFFTREELLYMPPILALESDENLAGSGMFNLSRLLLSGRKIDILVTTHPAHDPNLDPSEDHFAGNRFELAYLGISHREAQVHQSSAARPHHLLEGFLSSLDATCAALHVVADCLSAEGKLPHLGFWMQAAAALEGRAHPYSHYNPEAGATWARRFDCADNPQPEEDWPKYDLPCSTADGDEKSLTVAFTFADYALIEERYRGHYRVIPPQCPSEDLVELSTYLSLNQRETDIGLPFIWAADERGGLHRIAISHSMVCACRDRLDYWRTLQELAGIKNEYVQEAIEYERAKLNAQFSTERKQLEAEHQVELDRVRNETAGEAYQRLAQALLGTDVSALTSTFTQSAAAPTAPSAAPDEQTKVEDSAPTATTEEAVETVEEDDDEDELAEPWIDSALCTTCNDCMQINAQVFVYNSNKQAIIKDVEAGTYAEMVKAAEICPAKCIHPGNPLNPDEPNLKELIERAKPFR